MSKSLVDRGKQTISSQIFSPTLTAFSSLRPLQVLIVNKSKAVDQESTWGITQDEIIF